MSPTQIEFVPVDLIDPHPHNPRRDLGDLAELADSIKASGIQQNLLLVPSVTGRFLTAEEEELYGLTKAGGLSKAYTAVIGHRRLAAAKLAGLTEVPAVINPRLSESEQIQFMILENVQRENLSPIEEAEGYQQLLDLGVKVRQIAKSTGRSEKTVTARLRLMQLSAQAREMVHTDQATLKDAADLQSLEDQPDLYAKVAAKLGTTGFSYALHDAQDTRKRRIHQAPMVAYLAEVGIPRLTDKEEQRPTSTLGGGVTVEELGKVKLPADLTNIRYRLVDWSEHITLYKLLPSQAAAAEARQAERQKLDDERAQLIAESDAMMAHRDQWVRSFIARKRIAAKDQLAILAAVAPIVLAGGVSPSSYQVDDWLRPGEKTDYPDLHVRLARVMEAFPASDPAGFLLAALHIAAGAPWSDEWKRTGSVTLYGLLEQLGYPVSDAERTRITPPDADQDDEEGTDD